MKIDSPEKFYLTIPKDIEENIRFRQKLHKILAKDKEAQKVFLNMCLAKPEIAYNTLFFTFDPRKPQGYRDLPFILRPRQEEAVQAIKYAFDNHEDLLFDKSRDEGVTELVAKYFLLQFLLTSGASFLVGSRKEEYVDGSTQIEGDRVVGSPRSIFHKILYGIAKLPLWLRPKVVKTHMHIENVTNGSVIDGESTNENFAAGDRRTAILVDEFGRVDYNLAQYIRESVHDVSDTVIYNSTHFYGRGHPFAKLRYSGKIKVFTMPWYLNPEKNKGLYKSPDINLVEIHDLDYYKEKYPNCFDGLYAKKPFKLGSWQKELILRGKFPDIKFIADGSNKWRSPWYDKEESKRDPRDVAQNLDMNPVGAGDIFFDPEVLNRIRSEYIKNPDYEGEIEYHFTSAGKLANIRFVNNAGKKRFKWWGQLYKNRPNQAHNYIVACDISLGTGASNSVAAVYDVNTSEKVGMFVCPNIPPESFCDYVIALCHWVGGSTKKPYLIWEANGPGGSFDKRRKIHGYTFCYRMTDERALARKHQKRFGWYSNKQTKYDLLLELRIALSEGLKTNSNSKKLIIYDEKTICELEDYIFYENGEVGLSTSIDESSGARSSHGDRVIPDGLAVLAMSEMPRAVHKMDFWAQYGSFAHRRLLYKQEKAEKDKNSPFWS